ncbi:MAG: hypothetical protein QM753_20025 [Thermomicrobiales bacterium]
MDVLSWSHLTSRPPDDALIDGLSAVSLILFAAVFVMVSALALWPRFWGLRRCLGRNRYSRWLSAGLWLSSLGLIALILRFLRLDPITLGRPIWLVVVIVGVAFWIGWLVMMLAGEPAPMTPSGKYPSNHRRPRKGGAYR